MEASTPLMSNIIPNDIIRHIVLQLPMKAVIRCQCVCKEWRSLIDDDSDFKLSYRGQRRVIILSRESKSRVDSWNDSRVSVRTTIHDLGLQIHNKLPFGGEAYPLIRDQYGVRVLCSCNGFVLLLADERDILLWNPSTRCSTKVLEAPYPDVKWVDLAGLCYNSCTRDYKAVLLLRRRIMSSAQEVLDKFVISASLSLSHKVWRPVQFPYIPYSTRGGVDFRNTFHWWVSDIKDCLSGNNRIIYFDPVGDELRILPIPELRHMIFGLGVIDNCLCMATCILHKEEEPKTIQVLIMKEYGRQESWITAFTIQMPELRDIYGLIFYSQKMNTQEEEVFFLGMGFNPRRLYVYDRKKLPTEGSANELRRGLRS